MIYENIGDQNTELLGLLFAAKLWFRHLNAYETGFSRLSDSFFLREIN